uniref:rho-associated protein kinase 1-like n=2 Tax=Scatophagus argus TaxID=75038 RepID=UPI001ED7F539|nr:rho-associated protein kinase 1-like [Scatophagus argus]
MNQRIKGQLPFYGLYIRSSCSDSQIILVPLAGDHCDKATFNKRKSFLADKCYWKQQSKKMPGMKNTRGFHRNTGMSLISRSRQISCSYQQNKAMENTQQFNKKKIQFRSPSQVHALRRQLEKVRQQNTVLHETYEELQAAHTDSQKMFSAELQKERQKNRLLQEQLEKMKVSFQEISQRYEAENVSVRQQAGTLQCEFEKACQEKMILLKHCEELQETHRRSMETITADLQMERENKVLLQKELDKIKLSYHENHLRYETDVLTARQHVDTLQLQLDKEIKSHSNTVSEAWSAVNKLSADKETLCQKIAEVRETLQQKQTLFERELEELKTQLNVQISVNLELSTELEEIDSRPPRKIARRMEKHEDEPRPASATDPLKEVKVPEELWSKQKKYIFDAPAFKVQEEGESSEGTLQTKYAFRLAKNGQ